MKRFSREAPVHTQILSPITVPGKNDNSKANLVFLVTPQLIVQLCKCNDLTC